VAIYYFKFASKKVITTKSIYELYIYISYRKLYTSIEYILYATMTFYYMLYLKLNVCFVDGTTLKNCVNGEHSDQIIFG
jgi:hypothetical protein